MDYLTVFIMRLLGLWNNLKPFEIDLHKAENKEMWKKYLMLHTDRFIEDQGELGDFKYGKKSLDFITKSTVGSAFIHKDGSIAGRANLCGIVAIYNACVSLGAGRSRVAFASIIENFERKGLLLNGCMGTSPRAILNFLKSLGFDTKLFYAGDLNTERFKEVQESFEAFIYVAYNSAKHIKNGMHFICVTKDSSGGFVPHNSQGGLSESRYGDLENAVRAYNDYKSKPICVIGIKNVSPGQLSS